MITLILYLLLVHLVPVIKGRFMKMGLSKTSSETLIPVLLGLFVIIAVMQYVILYNLRSPSRHTLDSADYSELSEEESAQYSTHGRRRLNYDRHKGQKHSQSDSEFEQQPYGHAPEHSAHHLASFHPPPQSAASKVPEILVPAGPVVEDHTHAPFVEGSPRIAVVAYVPFKDNNYYTIQFASILYSSWHYVISHAHLGRKAVLKEYTPLRELVIVDLLVYCAPKACNDLPSECVANKTDGGKSLIPLCIKYPLDEHKFSSKYGWINALTVVESPSFDVIRGNYRYILRLDIDTLITPAMLNWLPPEKAMVAIGPGGYGAEFANKRLEEIAAKLGLRHQKVHNIGSSFYIKPQLVAKVLQMAVNLTMYLADNEFNPKLPGLDGLFKEHPEGTWPTWWRGVASMYGSELALNELVDNMTTAWVKGWLLDHASCSTDNVLTTLQIHCLHGDCQFRKFDFMDAIINLRNARTLDPRLLTFYDVRDVSNMTVAEYSTYIAWHGAARFDKYLRDWVKAAMDIEKRTKQWLS